MAAAGIAVSVSMGALKPVLEKLATLLGDKYKKLKGIRKEVSFLMEELSDMKVLLENMDNAEDELNPQAKKWRKDIIDMSYDIEDCIDNFMDRVGDADDKVGILKKASHYLRTINDRYRIANQINEIKTRVIEASKRRDRYNLNVCTSGSTTIVAVDPRLTALYTDSTTLVGIGTQKEELVKWVEDEEKQLKVMSIVGFGGLGKTTLANEVYHDVEGHFNSKAFVPVSQKPDISRLLNSVCSKLGLSSYSHACEVQDLIDNLREYLHDKRYLIVLDDLWEVKHWDIISCAFPKNSQQSRLIVTTRIEGVAQACCKDHGRIHYMKPLSDADSRKLFFRRIFGTEDTCPPQFTEVSSEILKKCGGLPLAIVTMASSLADQPKEHWDYIQRSIVTESAANSLADMMQILDLSYKHLPHHLRACFLYLGIYPEDYEIERDQLIYLWVAERIVTSKSPMQDVKDVAESCFNELVNRNMIQPESYYYRVHDMMLDLIIKRCREDNFVSVVHSAQVVVERQDRVHRLSVSLSDVPDDDSIFQVATNCCRSQVRSLVILEASKWMPPLLELKSLRVLFLKFPKHLKTMDLTGVCQLSQLRYLKVDDRIYYSERSIVLPSEIGRMRHLERLEIPNICICSIPSDIVDLPRLSHLILSDDTSLPDGIGKMKSLRTLRSFLLAESSPEDIKGLGQLNKLEDLEVRCHGERYNHKHRPKRMDSDTPTAIWMDALIFSLEKLSNLKRFCLSSEFTAVGADALLLLSTPFQNLKVLYLHGLIFSRVPRWIGGLQKLCLLTLGAKQMTQEDINIIGTLPYLTGLWLRISGMPTGTIVIGGTTGFNALELFAYDCDVMSYLAFEDGAMPSLRELDLVLDPHKWDKVTPLGLQCLSNLKKITVWTVATSYSNDAGAGDKESEEMSAAALVRKVFQGAADSHPSHPAFDEGNFHRPAEQAQE
ncbi:putative disease resistance RPP13-like protein 3 [Sorghum bicolor]|uniref:Uncharacterized protein n=1 Tax=Sorghum bicolor TaxID=4558 RepID=A0A1B6PER1_SORBI|nr:putative disease resistance RPP13-like protein 3 [Sorghum bicolor]XP_021321005.1 putative disease resistance RPP13-like protein 3 [Sorghum bicolor]XP_021321006.1 putative disease resistance RPP13-like protein 3 [Sorghum bicolor]KXG24189.1 hypothetical protein SORBI_3007G006100 [Sorghum bicolor]|eukprot:XP_021321004.1 putative disease resistance RPP13-like protein 3 [Sorghum bicolor]